MSSLTKMSTLPIRVRLCKMHLLCTTAPLDIFTCTAHRIGIPRKMKARLRDTWPYESRNLAFTFFDQLWLSLLLHRMLLRGGGQFSSLPWSLAKKHSKSRE